MESEAGGEDEDGEHLQLGQSTIVIHPGSLHLRIGRASDPQPTTLPHCIAWRNKNAAVSSIRPWITRPETEVRHLLGYTMQVSHL